MTRGEFYKNRYISCGALDDWAVKAMSEATKIMDGNGKTINWPQEELQPTHFPVMILFYDGSFLKIADVPSPLSKNVKLSWGTYTHLEKMN
jgi:hypothetical protein